MKLTAQSRLVSPLKSCRRMLCRLLLPLLPLSVQLPAATVYVYTGQVFSSFFGSPAPGNPALGPSDRVTASITVEAPIVGPLHDLGSAPWWFSVGPYYWSSAVGDAAGSFYMEGDHSGQIVVWDLGASRPGGSYPSVRIYSGPIDSRDEFVDIGSPPTLYVVSSNVAGTWTMYSTSDVPEPNSFSLLFLAALAGAVLKMKGNQPG